MALNVKQQIKKQGFETSRRKKKTERGYISCFVFDCISAVVVDNGVSPAASANDFVRF